MASSSTPAATGSYARSLKSLDRCLEHLPKDINANLDDVRGWGEEFTDLLVSADLPFHKSFNYLIFNSFWPWATPNLSPTPEWLNASTQ